MHFIGRGSLVRSVARRCGARPLCYSLSVLSCKCTHYFSTPLSFVETDIYIMSDALVWHCIRDNNSFLYKRGRSSRVGGVQLSSEPGNVMNVNSFKYSGLANSKAFSVQAKAGGGVEFVRKVSSSLG